MRPTTIEHLRPFEGKRVQVRLTHDAPAAPPRAGRFLYALLAGRVAWCWEQDGIGRMQWDISQIADIAEEPPAAPPAVLHAGDEGTV